MGLGKAVVIGGSIAGLTAARALSEFFDHVTIVERDELPTGPEHRAGVPQAMQLHVCLPIGAEVLEEFFPGFKQDLHDNGCPVFDEVNDTPWFGGAGWRARRESDVMLFGFARPVFEHTVRERLRALGNVEIMQGTATGLAATEDNERVTGVEIATPDDTTTLHADLVVDASGRGSKSPKWLEAMGYEPPAEQHVRAYFGYASRMVKLNGELPQGLGGVITMPFPGSHKGGCFLPADNGRYTLCAIGAMKDHPPGDEEAFAEYLRQAPSPLLAEMAELSEPLTEINTYHHPGNQRRLWEDMERRPRGFIPIGDSVASFNPVYGQGMSVAAFEARKLRDRLKALDGDLDALPDAFMEDLRASVEFPYAMATGADSNYEGVKYVNAEAPPPEGQQFFAVAEQVATEDPDVARDILHAVGWFEPELLSSPELVAKVEAWIASGRTVTNNDPAVVRDSVTTAA
jgi:2-polyprenyl-6-methoxyphenol hydroxylase-like FAD-dependent oxidoreductase